MFHDVLWSVVMCHDVLSGFVMCNDVLSWFMMCHDVLSWFVMCHHGLWCVVMCHNVSLSWFRHGSSWFVMFHCHGFVMVSSWFVMVRDVSVSWFRHGSSWFVMCYSLKFSRRRSCDPLFSQSGSQIHYQISFLMRLLIFPFPFKEHTSKELC